jgi:hypothetical protein
VAVSAFHNMLLLTPMVPAGMRLSWICSPLGNAGTDYQEPAGDKRMASNAVD